MRVNVIGRAGTYDLGFPGGVRLDGGGSYMRFLFSDFLSPERYQCDYSQAGENCVRGTGWGGAFPGSIGIVVPYDNPNNYDAASFEVNDLGCVAATGSISFSGPVLTVGYTYTPP